MTPERWQRIDELYHAARERGRDVLVDADPELRRKVEELLLQDTARNGVLDRPAADLLGDSGVVSLAAGTRLGPYKIEAPVGKGGMGVVYRAWDTKLNRPVAVKMLSGELADAAARRRFQREAQTASSLNHPHILTVHDAGEVDEGQYLVTEFVDGGTLRDWVRAERRDWRQIVELLVGVADGLATAHDAGILHRDVKPENILVARNGYAKLADFGLAKLADVGEGDLTRTLAEHRTRPGIVIGTIAYMSPEQAAGKPLDPRSDIFSFAVVLYEALAGRRPFAGTSDLELLQNIVHGVPQPLPRKIPEALRGLVEKALEKNPADRYQSMRDMVVDLRRMSRQSLETAAPATPSRKPRWIWLAGAALVLIASIAAWKFRPPARLHQVRSIAVLPLRNVSSDPDQQYFADGMTDALTTGLAQVGALSVIARTSAMRYLGTQKSTPEIARELHVDAVVEGSVQRSGNRVRITAELVDGSNDHHLWARSYERDAGDALGLQNEVAQAIASEIQVKLTPQEQAHLAPPRPVNPEAQEAYLRGIYWRDKADRAKTLGYLLEATKKDPNYATAWAALSATYGIMIKEGLLSDKEGYPKWRAAVTRAMELDDTLAESHVALGVLLQYHDYNWRDAETEFLRAIQLNPNLARAHLWLSDGFASTGRLDQAIAEATRALQLDPYSPGTGMRGSMLWLAGRNDESIEQGRKMLALNPVDGHSIMGLAWEQKGNSEQAISELQKAVGPVKDGFPQPIADLAHAYAVFGKKQQAVQLLDELKEMSRRRFVPSWAFAIVYTGLGDKDRAFEWLDKAYDERPSDIMGVKVDPRMEPLRSDGRYQEMLLRMGLPR